MLAEDGEICPRCETKIVEEAGRGLAELILYLAQQDAA
jgi:hypothetical protein